MEAHLYCAIVEQRERRVQVRPKQLRPHRGWALPTAYDVARTVCIPEVAGFTHRRDHCGFPYTKGARVPSLLLAEQLEIGRDNKKIGSSWIPRAVAAALGEIEERAALRMLARWVAVEQALPARRWSGARRIVHVQLDRRLGAGHWSSWETPAPRCLRASCSKIGGWRTRA